MSVDVSLRLTADLADLRKELGKLPDVGEDQAKALVKALEKQYKAAARAANRVAKEQGKANAATAKAAQKALDDATRDYEKRLDDIKRGGEKIFGGIIGDVEDVGKGFAAMSSTAGGAAAAFGVAGLAVGAFTVGVVKSVEALFSFVNGGQAAVERLKEIGGTEPLPQATIDALQDWTDGALGMEIAGNRLHALLAGDLASVFGELPYIMAGTADQFTTLAEYAGTFERTLSVVGSTIKAIDIVVFGDRIGGLAAAFRLAADEGHRLVERQKVMLQIQGALDKATKQAAEESQAYRDEQREMAEALGLVVDLEEDAKWKADQLAEAKKRQSAATRDAAAAAREEAAAQAEWERELIAKLDAGIEAQERQAEFDAKQRKAADDAIAKSAKAEKEAAEEIAQVRLDSFNASADAFQTLSGLIMQGNEDMTEGQKEAAMIAFRLTQSAGLAQVAINTAIAITRALAELGPIAGPVAAFGLGATGAAQAAVIASQQPPEFPTGGMVRSEDLGYGTGSPDHGAVGVQAGEGIVNRRGMAALGEGGLNALNAGMGGGGGPMVVQQVYRHRVFDRFVRDNLRRGGPLSKAISGARKPGHSNRG